jgi:hypothetical protein
MNEIKQLRFWLAQTRVAQPDRYTMGVLMKAAVGCFGILAVGLFVGKSVAHRDGEVPYLR